MTISPEKIDISTNEEQKALIIKAIALGRLRPLTDEYVCFTGKFSVDKAQLHALVEMLGGTVNLSVGAHTTIVVADDINSKTIKVRAAHVRRVLVIDEAAFISRIYV